MKIKRLDIRGFKSFVDPTTLTFPDPVTAVVGPNGCGKSNIVDAIRWVMGEQSAKHLRGRAMDDVIFAGSESRGPAGMAEVSLTFDARALPGAASPGGVPWGAVGPEEVVVTRRLYRAGDSEYLLGGVPCRLRDIVDFFLGTGVGSKAYAIIEQGRIGFIVSSRAEDRRGLIDEAAGITKYKAKKKLAERRMESTRQHLLRATDIIGEIETRLRSLRLQAQKAERYKRYKTELRDIELWSASQKFLGLLAEEKSLRIEVDHIDEQHQQCGTGVQAEELSVEAERLSVTEEITELAAAKDELFVLSNKAQLGSQRALHSDSEAAGLAERALSGKREIDDLTVRTSNNAGTIDSLEGQLVQLEQDADKRRADYQEIEEVHERLRGELATSRRSLDEAQSATASALARRARLESDLDAAAARLDDLKRRLETLAGEDGNLASQEQEVVTEASDVEGQLVVLRDRRSDLERQRGETELRVAQLRGEVARGELELETLREESHRRRSRLQSLGEIQTRYESFQRGVRAIMKQYRSKGDDTVADLQPWTSSTAVRGVVADIVQPPPELETAVEAVLGERLGNIIVESHDVGVDAIAFLKTKSEGRSSFIPLSLRTPGAPISMAAPDGTVVYEAGKDLVVPMPVPSAAETAMAWPAGDGVRGPMLELIGYDRQYDSVAAYLLGDVVVVEDLNRALALWRQTNTNKTIVTLDGEVIDPHGVVTGGSRESAVAGILTQKREIRELEEIVARLDADYQEALSKHISAKQALTLVMGQLDDIVASSRNDEMTIVALQKDLDRATRDRRQFELRRAQLDNENQNLARSLAQTEARIADGRVALEKDIAVAAEADTRATTLRAETTALMERLDTLVGELTELKIAASQADDRKTAAHTTLDRLRREQDEHRGRRSRLEVTVAEDLTRAETLRQDAGRLRDEAALWQAEAEARARLHAERQSAVEDRSATLSRREAELRSTRAALAKLTQTLSGLRMRSQEASLKRAALEEHAQSRYRDVVLSDVVFDYHLRAPVGPTEEARITELRGLIERMGEINLTAIEESAELQKRYDFLTTQKADLESAIHQLETAIEKINRASRKRFREVFDAVNAKFEEVFPRLFGGGRARLGLTDENDLLETGVEIIANPPGKKVMQSIELLSGGEKALTAVSLLFAIFLVKPSPFCLLDEVDAPLDEANVGRFNQVVREMTDRSQFILITHNRRTMEIADRLCGITMEEPGVSKLVAVNLRGSRAGRASVDTRSAAEVVAPSTESVAQSA